MISNLTHTGVLFMALILMNTVLKNKHNWLLYAILAVIHFCIFSFGPLKAQESPSEFIREMIINESRIMRNMFDQEIIGRPIDAQEIAFCREKIKFHRENADRCYQAAKDTCWWLPNLTMRDNARYAINTTCGAAAGALGGLLSSAVGALIALLGTYGLDCCEQWSYISDKLTWAQHHLEEYEYYTSILKNNGIAYN